MASYDNNLDELESLLRDLDGRPKSVAPAQNKRPQSRDSTINFNELDDIINVLGDSNKHSAGNAQPQRHNANVGVSANAHYGGGGGGSFVAGGGGGGGAYNNKNVVAANTPNNRNTLDSIDDLLRGLESNRASVAPVQQRQPANNNYNNSYNSNVSNGANSPQQRPAVGNSNLNMQKNSPLSPNSSANQKVFVAKPPSVRPVSGNDLNSLLDSITGSAPVQHSNPGAKGSCASCGRPILGESISALGATYHPEHFSCGNCHRPLGTSNFFEQDGVPNCEKCYQELLCARCAHCEEPILDRCVTALGKKWHANHFICTQCLSPFASGSYFERDGRPFCDNCFQGNFAPRCAGCNQPIKGEVTNALGQYWHPEHFVCQFCQKAFTGSFFEFGGKPYCDVHYHQQTGSLCAGCGKAVTGKCVNALDKKWHPEHFVCAFCMNPLHGGNYTENAGKAYDKECHAKLFG